MKKIDRDYLIGQKFNRWTVVNSINLNSDRHPSVHCRCDCGEFASVDTGNLLSLKTKGCRKCTKIKFIGNGNPSWRGYKDIPMNFFRIIEAGAIIRDIPFQLNIEQLQDLWEIQDGICALSGIKLKICANKNQCTASLDRIDSGIGYTVENVQFVHKHINMMKNRFPQQYFLDMCSKIARKVKIISGTACEHCIAGTA
jgi:hypothetical protein